MFLFLQLPQKTEKWDSLRMFETNFALCFALLRPKCTGCSCFFTFYRLFSVFFYNFSVIP